MRREFITFLLVFTTAFVGVFGPVWYHLSQTPAGTTFPFADGWLPDYYQYLSWIRDGMDGNLLVNTSYTEKIFPKLPIQMYYPLIGFLGKLIGIQEAYQIHLLGRILSLGLLLTTIWWVSRKLYSKYSERILVLICLLTTTGWWWMREGQLVEPITWSGNFNVIGKFGMPPHHALAIVLLLFSGLPIAKLNKIQNFSFARPVVFAKLIFIPIAIGLLNPSILTFVVLIWGGCLMLRVRKITALLIFISLPILLYHFWIFNNIEPWSVMYAKMKAFNPPTTFWQYFLSLGLVGWMGLIGGINRIVTLLHCYIVKPASPPRKAIDEPYTIYLALWGIIPLLMFPLTGRLLPINTSRLFQSYQLIPLALLAPMGIRLLHRTNWIVPTIIGIILIIHASVPYYFTLKSNLDGYSTSWYNMYLPNDFMKALKFLKENTPPESVVVSGENASLMIPAFTHNRTLIARDDIRPDYFQVRDQVFALVDGRMSEVETRQFLSEHNVKYLLLGLDTKPLSTLSQLQPFFSPIFVSGSVTVAQIKIN